MIALREQHPRFTPAEYLAWEEQQEIRYESTSLQGYVLVSTTEMCLKVYQPTQRGRWELTTYTDGELVELNSVNLSVSIDQIYEDLIFAPEELSIEL